MSDIQSKIAEAIKQLKTLAAQESVRVEGITAEVRVLEKRQSAVGLQLDAAIDGGSDSTAEQLILAKNEIDLQLADKQATLDAAKAHYDNALAEIKELRRTADDAKGAQARAVVAGVTSESAGFFSLPDTSLQDRALENARAHIHALDAEVALGDELSGVDRRSEAATAKLDAQEADLRARAELAELKAKLKASKGDGGGETGGGNKRTM